VREIIFWWLLAAAVFGLAWGLAGERAHRAAARRAAERERIRAEHLEHCSRGDHRTTIDATHATLYETCVDCGLSEPIGHAFLNGTNRRERRAS
jgi:hypothetical protein